MQQPASATAAMRCGFLAALLGPACVAALRFAGERNGTANGTYAGLAAKQQPMTFQGFYSSHMTGRGIWKWSNALDAYQRHLAPLAGRSLALVEVGVQSGGSILMWKAVLGPGLHYYGLDINTACHQFADASTTITIGDQADEKTWEYFYGTVRNMVDIVVDDGGHQSHQMGVTLHRAWEHINPGGFMITEDINAGHVPEFLTNAAKSIGWWSSYKQVESVHFYPALLVLHKVSSFGGDNFRATLPPTAVSVSDFASMWAAIPMYPGLTVAVRNQLWGSFLTEVALTNILGQFAGLYGGTYYDVPSGCSLTAASVCTGAIQNSPVQAAVIGVHVYDNEMLVELAAHPPVIQAVRRGQDWIPYGF